MTVGLLDEFTPPDATFALAASGRVPIVEPVHAPIEALELLDIEPAGLPPYRGNVAGGEASAATRAFAMARRRCAADVEHPRKGA